MKKLWNSYGMPFVFTLLPAVSGLLILQTETVLNLRYGLLIAAAVLWVIALLWLDHESSAAGPVLVLVVAFIVYSQRFGGWLIIAQVVRFWQETPDESWIASDGLILLILMASMFILFYLVRFFWTRLITAIAISVLWIFAAFHGSQIPKLAVILQIPLILYVLAEVLSARSKEQKKNAPQMVLMALLFSLILSILPVSAEPYPYKVLNKVWDGAEALWKKVETQFLYRSRGGTEFAMDFHGNYDRVSIGEDDEDSDHTLTAWIDFGDQYVVYLQGSTLDYFDGRAWSHSIQDADAGDLLNWDLDTAEHIYALWRSNQADDRAEISDDVFRRRRVIVGYQQMDTRTLFTTPGLLRIALDEERYPYHAMAGQVQFDYNQKRDTEYTLFFLEENTDNVARLIQESEGYTYDGDKLQSWGQIAGDYSDLFLLRMLNTVQIEEKLAARDSLIDQYYLQIPDGFSEEIRTLALDITKDCTTDYEKAQAVAAYLQENFTYTRHPDRPGASEDFLEHMMDIGEGYCTWFATASTMFLRAAGVPARYVQGYVTPLYQQTRRTLHDQNTHAWCEAYIQGYGWVVVESTPGYTTSYAAWERIHEDTEEEAEEEPAEEVTIETDEKEKSLLGGLVISVAAILGLTAVGFFLIRRYRKKQRYQQLNWTLRTREDVQTVFNLLAKRGYVRYPHESIRTFFSRVYWEDLQISREQARETLRVFEDALFGEAALEEADWQKGQVLIAAIKRKKAKRRR